MIFKNFLNTKKNKKIKKDFQILLKEQPLLFKTLKPDYKYSYSNKTLSKYKKFSNIRIIGMGGSILGSEAIYDFLKKKIKKKIIFVNNLNSNANYFNDKNINLNLIISKSGMLPAELMDLNENKFKQFNNLIKNKTFVNNLVDNVAATLKQITNGKFTSVILNYDEQSENLFKWYQQLLAESLGKKSKGLLPVISSMPKDNHSLMQLYLDGPKKSFYTFFNVLDNSVIKINNNNILNSHKYLRNQSIEKIKQSQMLATEKVFTSKKIPFRSFRILKRNEKSLGELFCFFILETILLGRALNVNPFDQPSVELIKKETKKILR